MQPSRCSPRECLPPEAVFADARVMGICPNRVRFGSSSGISRSHASGGKYLPRRTKQRPNAVAATGVNPNFASHTNHANSDQTGLLID
jgi:hypothetical protein